MRRRNRHRLILAVLLSGAVGSCTPDATCTGDWCGTAVVVTGAEADVLFPPASQSDVGIGLSDLIFFKLADIGPSLATVGDSTFVPLLAESWRFLDSLTLEFTLHPEARWHDGVPVTARDVAFSFDVYRDPLLATIAASRLARITSVTPEDERTVVFRFSSAYPEQFFDAVYHMRIIPRHVLDSVPRARLSAHPFGRAPVGNGPFRFVRWNAGESVELVADSAFFLGRPGLRRIIWRFAADGNVALNQLLAGDADILNVLGGPDNVARVSSTPEFRVVDYPSSVYAYVTLNFWDPNDLSRPHPLFADRDVRRAVTMAIDRQAIATSIFGAQGRVPPGPVSPALWIWSEDLEGLPFDTAAARRILAARGWTDSDGDNVLDRGGDRFEFELLVPTSSATRRQAAQIIQDQLRRFGIVVAITEMEFNTFRDQGPTRRWDAWFGAYGGDISAASMSEVWSSDAFDSFNHGRYSSPEFDQLVQDAMDARDIETARRLWHAALTTIMGDAPAIWVYAPLTAAGVQRRFENATIRADQWAADLWKWRVPAAQLIDRDRYAN